MAPRLLQLLSLLGVGATSPQRRLDPACERADVIVVGAGVAGLVAASALKKAGLAVILLEGRERVGGRLHSTPEGIDLGGSWTWEGEDAVRSLAAAHGLELTPQRLDGEALMQTANGIRGMGNVGEQIAPCGPGASRYRGGFHQLASKLAAPLGAELRLNSRVTSISAVEAPAAVRIAYVDQQSGELSAVEAARVVMAIPPRLASELEFEPPLPDDQFELMNETPTWAGDWAKVIATFGTAFWRNQGQSGAAVSEAGPLFAWWEAAGGSETGEPLSALAGLVTGQERSMGLEAVALNPQKLRAAVAGQLGKIFGAEVVEAELKEVYVLPWSGEHFTYAPHPYGEDEDDIDPRPGYGSQLLKAPTEWGVHFAGTESEAALGHVDGAVSSGERAASEVIAALASRRRRAEARAGAQPPCEPAAAGTRCAGAGVAASGGGDAAWREAWSERLDCWLAALPPQALLGDCLGALSLHVASRIGASWRAAQSLMGAPRAAVAPAAAAAGGCEWIREEGVLSLPALPAFPAFPTDVEWTLPPIPQLLPSWQQQLRASARSITGGVQRGVHGSVAQSMPSTGAETEVRSSARRSPNESWASFGLGAAAGVGIVAGMFFLIRCSSARRSRLQLVSSGGTGARRAAAAASPLQKGASMSS